MIIALELDGMICTPISNPFALQDVSSCVLLPGAKEALDRLKSLGHVIFIYSHRDTSLCQESERWLQRNKVHYDRIQLGKPMYDIVLDSQSQRLTSWDEFFESNKYRISNSR